MIPVKTLRKYHVEPEEYYNLSDIKQIKLKMEYDNIIERTEILFSVYSLMQPFVMIIAFLILASASFYNINAEASVELMSLVAYLLLAGIYVFFITLFLQIVAVFISHKKRDDCMKVLFNQYFTQIKRKVKK